MVRYNPQDWFEEIPVIGKLTAFKAAEKLQEIGEVDAAEEIRRSGDVKSFASMWWPGSDKPKPWQLTSHTFGFI